MRFILGIIVAAILIGSAMYADESHAATHHGASSALASVGTVTSNVIIMDTDYCHPVKRHSKWWRCDGTSLARWLYDHPVAPKGIHPIARPKKG